MAPRKMKDKNGVQSQSILVRRTVNNVISLKERSPRSERMRETLKETMGYGGHSGNFSRDLFQQSPGSALPLKIVVYCVTLFLLFLSDDGVSSVLRNVGNYQLVRSNILGDSTRRADKSLALQRKQQATGLKKCIYSTYSPSPS
jgi:hypothetical protein